MTLAATFLGGAKSRLLPPSIPLRFFAAAAAFHLVMWIVLFVGAAQMASFRGGLGPVLAAVHLLTLGILTTTVVGASVQLLPVATRRALAAVWPIKLVFWLTVPGMSLLVAGMYTAEIAVLIPGAVTTTLGLILFAGLLANNLWRAGGLPIVAAYGWASLAALVLLAALGLALTINYQTGVLPDHGSAALAHMILGSFGFMGLLVLGFSHVLVPMFALSAAPAKIPAWIGFFLAITAVALGSLGALVDNRSALTAAVLIGLAAAGMHLWLMDRALKTGMRKRLGLSFLLVRGAWMVLPAALCVALAALYGVAGPNGPTLFGWLLIAGWLLSFLFGILQRILPFLASMHVAPSAGRAPPLMSELAGSAPLKLHAVCHGLALGLIALSIGTDLVWLAQVGSGVGLVGALSFAWFTADIMRRVFAAAPA